MPRLRVYSNSDFPRGRGRIQLTRRIGSAVAGVVRWFLKAWAHAFPTQTPPNSGPPLLARNGGLNQGALLREDLDVVAKKRAA